MTFDELWRLNLAQEQRPAYSGNEAEVFGMHTAPSENPNELKLTAEDHEFLSQVGIKP